MKNNGHKYKTLLSDAVIFAIGSLGSKLILFFLVPLYTNVLSTEQYGTAEFVLTVGQLVLPFVSLSIYEAHLRFGIIGGEYRENAFLCAGIVFLGGSLVTIALTPLVANYSVIAEWRWYLCAYVIASFFSSLVLLFLKVKGRNELYAAMSILQATLLTGCNIVFLLLLRTGIEGYLLSTIISTAVVALFSFFWERMYEDLKKARFSLRLMKEMLLYSAPLIINNISWWFIHSADKYMTELFLGASFLGLYTAASKIPALLNVVTTIFNQAWGLSAVREYDTSNDCSFYSTVFRYFLIVVFGACMIIMLIIKPFMSVYVGEDFQTAWKYVPLLLISAVFSGMSSFLGSMYSAAKKSKSVMTTTLVAGIINVGANYILIPHIGVYGAVIGTLLAYASITGLRMKGIKKYIEIDFSIPLLITIVLLALVEGVCITMDYHIYPLAAVFLAAFLFTTRKDSIKMINIGRKVLINVKNSRKKGSQN